MLELRRPLSRALNVPGHLVRRLTAFLSLADLRSIDQDYFILSMAAADPDHIYLPDSAGQLRSSSVQGEDIRR